MPSYNIVVFAGDYCGPEVESSFPLPQNFHEELTKKHRRSQPKRSRYHHLAQPQKTAREENRSWLTISASDPPGSRGSATAHQIRLPRTSTRRGTLHYELSKTKTEGGVRSLELQCPADRHPRPPSTPPAPPSQPKPSPPPKKPTPSS